MDRILAQVVDRLLAAAPGWMLLTAGLTLVAAVALTPAWLTYDRLAWEHDVLAAQTDHLQQQTDRYERLHAGLTENDPVLLKRLAYVELGLKPVGEEPLMPGPMPGATPGGPGSGYRFASSGDSSGRRGAGDSRADPPTPLAPSPAEIRPVTQWPVRPLPRVGEALPSYRPPNTRLTRLATGQSRYVLLAAGAACMLAGCWPGLWGNGSAREAEEE